MGWRAEWLLGRRIFAPEAMLIRFERIVRAISSSLYITDGHVLFNQKSGRVRRSLFHRHRFLWPGCQVVEGNVFEWNSFLRPEWEVAFKMIKMLQLESYNGVILDDF
jgi:hypothetical protein